MNAEYNDYKPMAALEEVKENLHEDLEIVEGAGA